MGSAIKGLAAALLWAASLGAQAIAAEWSIADLTPEGAGIATAVSQNGNVVGCRIGSAGQTQPFIYSNGERRDLQAPAGSSSCALAVNNSGIAAGRIDGEITVWDASSVRGLGVQGNVTGISESGAIVGAITDGPFNAGGPTRAFMWAGGVFTDLGISGTAIGINQRGQVAVISAGNLYLYENGSLRDLGANVVNAYGFDDRGEIVGMADFGHGPEPFIYDGAVHPIPGAASYAGAVGINNAGQVLGSGEGIYGFLIEGGQSYVIDRLPGVTGTSWRHTEPKAINDRGWIVGQGGSPDFHAFLLTPKQASTPVSTGNPAARAAPGTRPTVRTRGP
jgi:probable HAF family extracellular repeat protein